MCTGILSLSCYCNSFSMKRPSSNYAVCSRKETPNYANSEDTMFFRSVVDNLGGGNKTTDCTTRGNLLRNLFAVKLTPTV